jgi:TolA-binding protein
MRSYGQAAARYREFLSRHEEAPETPGAAMALGWAEFRLGDRARARRSWTGVADKFPADARAPLACVLAAEVASQGGDTVAAHALFHRLITQYPSTLHAGIARLSRSVLALRRDHEDEAVRELDVLVQSSEPLVIDAHARLSAALAVPGAEGGLDEPPRNASWGHGAGGGVRASGTEPLESFTTRLLGQERERTPYLLHGFVLLAAANRGWSDVSVDALAGRLVDDFPSYPAAPVLLARVAAASASTGQWPIARRAYEKLVARYPGTPMGRREQVEFAEALFRTGATVQARAQLEQAAAAGGDAAPRALLLLAQMDETGGRRREALAAYDRVLRDYPRIERSTQSLLSHARLLEDFGEVDRMPPLLLRVVAQTDGEVAAEAAYRLGRILNAEGLHADAVQWYMTAAYVAEGSRWARLALLGAGSSLTALRALNEAVAVYRKLLPANGLARTQDRETSGEAAYRVAEILRGAGQHEDALDMYLTSAYLTPGSPAEPRALVGAVQCLVARGDRLSAEAIYRRLLQSSTTEPEFLATARQALRGAGGAARDRSGMTESALPKSAR